MRMVKIIAHRGYAKNHAENTLAAFKAALDFGADAIELDVHLTRDGELLAHHDYYIKNALILDQTLKQIKQTNDAIPTLNEVFSKISSAAQYEIELKGATEEFLAKTLALASKHHLINNIEFTSPHPYVLTRLKQLNKSCKTGMFVAELPSWMEKKLGQNLAINNALLGKINVLHCPLKIIDANFIKNAHSHNLLVHAANCNTAKEISAAIALNVDQLSTDALELVAH